MYHHQSLGIGFAWAVIIEQAWSAFYLYPDRFQVLLELLATTVSQLSKFEWRALSLSHAHNVCGGDCHAVMELSAIKVVSSWSFLFQILKLEVSSFQVDDIHEVPYIYIKALMHLRRSSSKLCSQACLDCSSSQWHLCLGCCKLINGPHRNYESTVLLVALLVYSTHSFDDIGWSSLYGSKRDARRSIDWTIETLYIPFNRVQICVCNLGSSATEKDASIKIS